MTAMAGEAGPKGARPPRSVCDEMMKRLARWLRAAGYDTLVPEDGARDRAVPARALAKPLRHCPRCARLYSAGGRVRRMRARLEAWSKRGLPPP